MLIIVQKIRAVVIPTHHETSPSGSLFVFFRPPLIQKLDRYLCTPEVKRPGTLPASVPRVFFHEKIQIAHTQVCSSPISRSHLGHSHCSWHIARHGHYLHHQTLSVTEGRSLVAESADAPLDAQGISHIIFMAALLRSSQCFPLIDPSEWQPSNAR